MVHVIVEDIGHNIFQLQDNIILFFNNNHFYFSEKCLEKYISQTIGRFTFIVSLQIKYSKNNETRSKGNTHDGNLKAEANCRISHRKISYHDEIISKFIKKFIS